MQMIAHHLPQGLRRPIFAKIDLQAALQKLSTEHREVLVLREIEGMSYKEIADVASVSIGTVMSRLARARTRLRQSLSGTPGKEQ